MSHLLHVYLGSSAFFGSGWLKFMPCWLFWEGCDGYL